MSTSKLIASGLAAALAAPCLAQGEVDPAHKFAWGENIGWTNWADADGGADGVHVHGTFMSGYLWGENVGWISVGDGTPGGGASYTNASGADHGVNIAGDGTLSGFAWGENIGWINFDTSSLGADRARLDAAAGRLRGWAWGENIGWINLDDDEHYIGVQVCYADCDRSGGLTPADFSCFRSAFLAGDGYADCDGSGSLTAADFSCFRSAFLNGCP